MCWRGTLSRALLLSTLLIFSLQPSFATAIVKYSAAGFQGLSTAANETKARPTNSVFLDNSDGLASFDFLYMHTPSQYGGADSGSYGVVGSPTGDRYTYSPVWHAYTWSSTLSFKSPVSYFGFWWAAADPGNHLTLYSGKNVALTMDDQTLIDALGPCSGGRNPYCGNPNNGLDKKELFVYVNIYSNGAGFTSAEFQQTSWGGFEFDSLLYNVDPPLSTPEPASWGLLASGFIGIGLFRKFRQTKTH